MSREASHGQIDDAVGFGVADIVASVEEAVAACDMQGRVVFWNPSTERLFGVPVDRAVGRPLAELLEADPELDWLAEVLAGGTRRFRAVHRRDDGDVVQVEVTASPVRNSQGQVAGASQLIRSEAAAENARDARRFRANRILREAIDVVDSAICVYDQNDRFVLANRKYFELFPYLTQYDDLEGRTFEDVLRISLANRVVQNRTALDDPDAYVRARLEDRRLLRPMPERQHANGRWYLIRENKTPSGYTITARIDITARKQVELELSGVSGVLQAILDTMPNPLIAFDHDNRLVAWNEGFADMVEIDPAALERGRSLVGLAKEIIRKVPSSEAGIKVVFRAIGRGRPVEFDWQREDGESFVVLGRPMDDGGYLTMWRNVTAERRAEAQIRQAEQRLMDAIEAMSDAFAIFDKDDRLIVCNEPARRIYALQGVEVEVGRTFEEMTTALARGGMFTEAVGREEDWIAERLEARRNLPGKPFLQALADGRVLLVSDYRTREGGIVSIRTDMTERIRAENELRSARDALEEQAESLRKLATEIDGARRRAEEAGEAKSRFLAMMSHELRTPMTGLLGMIELMSRTGLDTEQQEQLDTMRNSAETLLALLNDILDFSKLEAGKVQLEEIVFSPTRAVRDVVQLFQAQASAKGLVLEYDVAKTVPDRLRGDPLRLKQILSNLISNAIKFTVDGRVSVGLDAAEGGSDTVRVEGTVADTGFGIAPEVQRVLFQAFEQADTSTTRRFGGTGLGLAICRRLAEGMGGEIGVTSEVGDGSTFRFSVLMRATGESSADPFFDLDEPEEDDPIEPLRPMRVLLVEDNDVNRMLVSKVLAQSGHTVDEAANGREAVEAVARKSYDVVLMDMQMPVMDGVEATRMIRDRPDATARLPIVALTADALPEHRERYLSVGVDDLMTKPIDWRLLNRTLARWGGGTTAAVPDPAAGGDTGSGAVFDGAAFDYRRMDVAIGILPSDRAVKLLGMLEEEMSRRLGEFRQAVSDADPKALRRVAHTIKGLAANFGAVRLESAARRAEMDGVAPDSSARALAEIELAVRETLSALPEARARFNGSSGKRGPEPPGGGGEGA